MSERTPAKILADIECAISPLIKAEGGEMDVVSTLENALELAGGAPNSWRVILNFDGYGSNPNAREGVSSVRFTSIVQMRTGMSSQPSERVYKDSVNGKPSFLQRVEQVSAWFRALRWPDGTQIDCAGLALEDSEWLSNNPKASIGMALSWSVILALPIYNETITIKL